MDPYENNSITRSKVVNRQWQIIAGEYPPQLGGVSDYTQRLVTGLAEVGDCSHVWTRGYSNDIEQQSERIYIHRCAGSFGPTSFKNFNRQLNRIQPNRLLLVQYVPHAFGFKAMNLPFAWWIRKRAMRNGDEVRLMIHEVAYPWVKKPIRHNVLAAVNEIMMSLMVGVASKVYVSTTAWNPRLVRLGTPPDKLVPLSIPSNVPEATDMAAVEKIRSKIAMSSPSRAIVGHFGTYGDNVLRLLLPIIERLIELEEPVHLLLIGGGSDRIREKLVERFPEWNAHISATGRISAMKVSENIRACDVMVQPFGDGANTRRTSLMACLINRRATVSTHGQSCEPFWSEQDVTRLSELHQPECAVKHLHELIRSPSLCSSLGERAFEYYSRHLSIDQTIKTLTA